MEPLKPGDVLGRYRLERPLGAGGMGSVWLAVQEGLGRRVALKVMHSGIALDANLAARFRQEAEVAASFNHPGIVSVTDFGVDGGRPFLVMDFLEGESLDAILVRDAPMPPARVAFFAIQILAALEAMHSRNIVHRDLKPDNVFVSSRSGVPDIARLLDFGIARVVEESGDSKMTTTGQVLGTPAYMSPEQAKGMPVTAASDLYALGVVMYESLAGRVPFEGENYHQLLFAIVEGNAPSLADLRPDLDGAFLKIVETAMAAKAAERFPDAAAMREALAPFAAMDMLRSASSPSDAPRASETDPMAATLTPEQVTPLALDETLLPGNAPEDASARAVASIRPPAKRNPLALVLALLLLVLGSAFALGAWVGFGPEDDPSSASQEVPEGPVVESRPRPETALAEAGEDSVALDEVEEVEEVEEIEEETESVEEESVELPTSDVEEPAPAAPPRQSSMARAGMSASPSRPRRIMARCGSGEHEMFLVRPQDNLSHGGSNSGDIGIRSGPFRERVREKLDELTACARGEYIRRGQDIHLTVNEHGVVTQARVRAWCPVPASLARCLERVSRTLNFSDLNGNAGNASFSFGIQGL